MYSEYDIRLDTILTNHTPNYNLRILLGDLCEVLPPDSLGPKHRQRLLIEFNPIDAKEREGEPSLAKALYDAS